MLAAGGADGIGQPYFDDEQGRWGQIETEWSSPSWDSPMREVFVPLPIRFAVRDRLCVREAWTSGAHLDKVAPRDISQKQSIGYPSLRRKSSVLIWILEF